MGAFVLLGAHMENQGLLVQSDVDTVRMRDVMLTQFSTLSASDTLEDALQRAVHTLQDVFPVVRGGNLVGAVSRQNIVEALATSGNSYVQGVMTAASRPRCPTIPWSRRCAASWASRARNSSRSWRASASSASSPRRTSRSPWACSTRAAASEAPRGSPSR
jgi:hypothetical protein